MLAWKTILVAVDFSNASRAALRSARALAARSGGRMHLVHVVDRLPVHYGALMGEAEPGDLDRIRKERAERRLERLLRRIRTDEPRAEGSLRFGRPWEQIVEAARELRADLVCIGNSGHSLFERLLLGSSAENVVRHSPAPVLVTRQRALGAVAKVLVPVDLEEGSERALRFVAAAFPARTQVHTLYVLPPPVSLDPYVLNYVADQKVIERDLRAFVARSGVRARYEVRMFGDPATEILRSARRGRADLIVIATHGRRGLARFFMGGVAEKIVRHADRPVLVLPGPGRARDGGKS